MDDPDHIIGNKSTSPPSCCQNKKKIFCISSVVIVAVLVFLWVAGLFQSKWGKHLPEGLQGLVDEDPFDGVVYEWNPAYVSGNKQLTLTIVDALEEKYHKYFEISVNDWNTGSPDVLNLRTRAVLPDPDCRSEAGAIRVCNKDYGDTRWKGQNSVLIRDGMIYASVALMNDFYLDRSTPEDREYIMCHEIGHGFGLPHTDEWFWNFDQGNCMDYTSRPRNNRKPGQVSFDRLARMYGAQSEEGPAIAAATSAQDGEEQTIVQSAEEDLDLIEKALQLFDDATTRSDADGEIEELEQVDIGDGYSVLIRRMLV